MSQMPTSNRVMESLGKRNRLLKRQQWVSSGEAGRASDSGILIYYQVNPIQHSFLPEQTDLATKASCLRARAGKECDLWFPTGVGTSA